ncbi:glycosyltransferase [Kozakia baliensis]|uniref:glycosyltransferase n=1 Tax=Kozakia baliensis TaxID=153496 RepID=UPI00087D26D6|nr:glycosyltransferase [Kozakia baliensis]AOX19557.1 hypothetical protein A0U90_03845 [Kozakia baliensis]
MFENRWRTVAIPARNEEERIENCLRSLIAPDAIRPHRIVVLVNNSTDKTRARIEALKPFFPCEILVEERHYDAAHSHAGQARHDAVSLAMALSPAEGLIFSTDADSRVGPGWIRNTIRAFGNFQVGAVFGRALLDPNEADDIPAHLQADDDAELAYGALLERIGTILSPDAHDPWPRHSERSGASIAVTCEALAMTGGIPLIPTGEDRAFYAALRSAGVPVRHAPDVWVWVSARVVGRAAGGMAETIARRLIRQDEFLDDALEPALDRFRRLRSRIAGDARLIRRSELPRHHRAAVRLLARLEAWERRSLDLLTIDRSDIEDDALVSPPPIQPVDMFG